MGCTEELATFCTGITLEGLPDEVVRKTKLCVLDYVANVYGSLELDVVARIVAYFQSLRTAEIATAVGCGFKTGLHHAAFLNGVSAEAIEAQDGLRFGGNHPGTAVISAALAVAEDVGAGGRSLLEAIVAGYETANRIAAAVHPHHTLSGFLPTGTCGTFGAACAAARLMGLDASGMLNALGNAGYLAPLSMAEQLMGGFTVKIAQAGQAAAAGITAAGLAAAGLTGAPYVLEGSELNGGFAQITVRGEAALDRITDRLGEHYTLLDVYFKPYSACRHTHGAAQATLELVQEERIEPEEVAAVDVHTYGIARLAVGKCVKAGDSFVAAQFSIPFVVAACLFDRELGPRQIREHRVGDPAVLELASRVRVHASEELDREYPEKTASRVELRLRDGRTLSRQIDVPRGDPRNPMDLEELSDKARRFAGGRNAEGIEEAIRLIMTLDDVTDVQELAEVL